jgi:hypothetical protein
MNKIVGVLAAVALLAPVAPVGAAEVQCGYGDFKIYNEFGNVTGCLSGANVEAEQVAARERQDVTKSNLFFKAGEFVTLVSGVRDYCPAWYNPFMCVIEKSKVR